MNKLLKYKRRKLELISQFCIKLTTEQKNSIWDAVSELEVDRVVRDILSPYDI